MTSRHRVYHSDFLKNGEMRHDVEPTNKCNISECAKDIKEILRMGAGAGG